MDTIAVVLEQPEHITLSRLDLSPPGDEDVVVDVAWSGISTGTERLLWSGRMPDFPGMGYPLVPGYESVGRISAAGSLAGAAVGGLVFVPGASCFGAVRGLFGGAAARLVVPGARVVPIEEHLAERGVLLALAATARHAIAANTPDLIIGHGVLGRLIARLAMLDGGSPTVWERNTARAGGAAGYRVCDPAEDTRKDYGCIIDASGDPDVLDQAIGRLRPGGEIVLAGFYADRLSFAFAPAFMKEARIRIAAQWQPADLAVARELAESGALSLDGLITHTRSAAQAHGAYHTAFSDPDCLKMVLDWRSCT